MNNKLLNEILEVKQLPSLPAVAIQVLSLAKKKDATFASISKAISNDPALSAKVLKTINSSFYGVTQPIKTINHALVLLGLQTIKTIALGFSLVRGLNANASANFDYLRFWRQSLFAAVSARALARITATGDCEEAFLAGLLSDLGTLAMHRALGDKYDYLLQLCQGDQNELVRLSRATFDLDHTQVGAALAERWKFPPSLIEPIRRHHDISKFPAKPGLVEVVHAAVLCAQTYAAKKQGLQQVARKELESVFHLNTAKIQELLKQIDAQSREMAELFELKIQPGRSYQDLEEEARQTLIQLSLEAQLQAQLALSHNKKLKVEANTDGLTGLANRRHFTEFLAGAFKTPAAAPLSLVLLDLDHFKSINDTHGHQAGDAVLEGIARLVKSMVRPNDLAARYGGEEMAVVLPQTSSVDALNIAEQLRQSVANTPIPFDNEIIKMTASFGVACMDPTNPFHSVDELIGAADRALYAAKESGRNCCRSTATGLGKNAA